MICWLEQDVTPEQRVRVLERQLRLWRLSACGLVVVGMVGLALRSGHAQEAPQTEAIHAAPSPAMVEVVLPTKVRLAIQVGPETRGLSRRPMILEGQPKFGLPGGVQMLTHRVRTTLTRERGPESPWRLRVEPIPHTPANLQGRNLSGANLREANLDDANLWGTNLEGADLRRASFRGADLREANLQHADLRGADLSCARHLTEAKLTGARYDRCTRWPEGFVPLQRGAVKVG
jgi:hypothetical protein